jgi:hypothetical protein
MYNPTKNPSCHPMPKSYQDQSNCPRQIYVEPIKTSPAIILLPLKPSTNQALMYSLHLIISRTKLRFHAITKLGFVPTKSTSTLKIITIPELFLANYKLDNNSRTKSLSFSVCTQVFENVASPQDNPMSITGQQTSSSTQCPPLVNRRPVSNPYEGQRRVYRVVCLN